MTNSDSAPIAVQKAPIVILKERLEARAGELRAALAEIPPERFIRAVITAAQINPEILACQWNSVWLACMKACRDGLLPDGVEGAIVPYKDKANWIPMYRGLLRKFQQSGSFKWITANVVREGETFEHWIDEHGEHFKHVPGENGESPVTKVYAMATTLQGGVFISVMSMSDIAKVRKMSRASRDDAPWNQWPEEMQKKSALRRLSKMLPTAPIPFDDEDDDEPDGTPKPVPYTVTRERGAAAALDLFAGSPEGLDSVTPSAPSGESAQAGNGGSAAGESVDQPAAPEQAPPDPLTIAYLRGKEAKSAKHERKALPGEYRSSARDAEAEAWLAGYDGKPKPQEQATG